MHNLSEGMILPVSLPRNHFSLGYAKRHIFIAGCIGITPFLSMLPDLISKGIDWELHICAKFGEKISCQSLLKKYEKEPNIYKYISH